MPRVENPQPLEIKQIDWEQFMLQMFSDAAYQRVATATQMQQSVARIETFFAVQGQLWEFVALLWQGMITGCPPEMRPTEKEAARWQAIADAANMPISFREGMLRYVMEADGDS